MDHLHLLGIQVIQWIQQFKLLGPLLTNISQLGSPPMAYALVFPAAYYINPILGLVTLLCTCFSEWLSGILKWVLHGHRPYWWVMLYAEQTRTSRLKIDQYPSTCETGPGSPSGHCMITLAAFVPIVLFVHHGLPSSYQKLMWALFGVFVILLGLSRLYLAAHFPHQVVAGIISGLAIGYLFTHVFQITRFASSESPRLFLPGSPISILVQYFLYHPMMLVLLGFASFFLAWLFSRWLQIMVGVDINWSIELARAACRHPEWVHLSTSLMVGFARIAGYLSGLSMVLLVRIPSKESLLQSHVGMDVILLSCIAAALTRSIAEPLCHRLITSCLSPLFPVTNGDGPGTVLLFSSVIEAASGPICALGMLPSMLSAFTNRST